MVLNYFCCHLTFNSRLSGEVASLFRCFSCQSLFTRFARRLQKSEVCPWDKPVEEVKDTIGQGACSAVLPSITQKQYDVIQASKSSTEAPVFHLSGQTHENLIAIRPIATDSRYYLCGASVFCVEQLLKNHCSAMQAGHLLAPADHHLGRKGKALTIAFFFDAEALYHSTSLARG